MDTARGYSKDERILVVVNPGSRAGAAQRRIPALLDGLRERALIAVIDARGDTRAVVAERLATGSFDRVVALGGDGTFARVADGVLDANSHVPLGLLPAGLANNHARGLGIPTVYDSDDAVDIALGARRIAMDVGLVNGIRFYDTLGIGFQAAALVRREGLRHRTGLGGELGYGVAAVRELFGAHGFGVRGTLDGRPFVRARVLDVIVSNSVWYGGRWVLDGGARVDDGLLEVVAVRGLRDLVRHALRGAAPGTADGRGCVITLETDRPVATQLDGEVGPTADRFVVTVRPRALSVAVPP
jgi:diacylglycerol kinase (ATP)